MRPNHNEGVQKLAKLIKDIEIAMLSTVDVEGRIHSRPMATQKQEFDGTLWFMCREDSPKLQEIKHDARVNIAYSSPEHQRYVSVEGPASVVKDRAKIEEFWSPVYKAWFPEGINDPKICLIRVDVESAQYWDSPASPVVHIFGLVKALTTGNTYKPEAASEKLNLA